MLWVFVECLHPQFVSQDSVLCVYSLEVRYFSPRSIEQCLLGWPAWLLLNICYTSCRKRLTTGRSLLHRLSCNILWKNVSCHGERTALTTKALVPHTSTHLLYCEGWNEFSLVVPSKCFLLRKVCDSYVMFYIVQIACTCLLLIAPFQYCQGTSQSLVSL